MAPPPPVPPQHPLLRPLSRTRGIVLILVVVALVSYALELVVVNEDSLGLRERGVKGETVLASLATAPDDMRVRLAMLDATLYPTWKPWKKETILGLREGVSVEAVEWTTLGEVVRELAARGSALAAARRNQTSSGPVDSTTFARVSRKAAGCPYLVYLAVTANERASSVLAHAGARPSRLAGVAAAIVRPRDGSAAGPTDNSDRGIDDGNPPWWEWEVPVDTCVVPVTFTTHQRALETWGVNVEIGHERCQASRTPVDFRQYHGPPRYRAPLGARYEMDYVAPASIAPARERRFVWSFVGSLSTNTRARGALVDALVRGNFANETDPRFWYSVSDGWAAAPGSPVTPHLSPRAYRRVLADSIFTLCPEGAHPEQYRLYEAWEAGSIPVLTRSALRETAGEGGTPCVGALSHLTTAGAPFVLLDTWADLPSLLEMAQSGRRRDDGAPLELVQAQGVEWYSGFMRGYYGRLEATAMPAVLTARHVGVAPTHLPGLAATPACLQYARLPHFAQECGMTLLDAMSVSPEAGQALVTGWTPLLGDTSYLHSLFNTVFSPTHLLLCDPLAELGALASPSARPSVAEWSERLAGLGWAEEATIVDTFAALWVAVAEAALALPTVSPPTVIYVDDETDRPTLFQSRLGPLWPRRSTTCPPDTQASLAAADPPRRRVHEPRLASPCSLRNSTTRTRMHAILQQLTRAGYRDEPTAWVCPPE
jgi:hypothetical protein